GTLAARAGDFGLFPRFTDRSFLEPGDQVRRSRSHGSIGSAEADGRPPAKDRRAAPSGTSEIQHFDSKSGKSNRNRQLAHQSLRAWRASHSTSGAGGAGPNAGRQNRVVL